MSGTQSTQPGPAEEAEGIEAVEPTEETTDADRTATAHPDGELDEAGEDEQIDGGLIDRALEEPPD